MELFTTISLFASGIYWIILSVSMKTNNIQSSTLFKALPALLGIDMIFLGLKHIGWI